MDGCMVRGDLSRVGDTWPRAATNCRYGIKSGSKVGGRRRRRKRRRRRRRMPGSEV